MSVAGSELNDIWVTGAVKLCETASEVIGVNDTCVILAETLRDKTVCETASEITEVARSCVRDADRLGDKIV